MKVLNDDFSLTGLRFDLVNVTRTLNSTWFHGVDFDNSLATEMKAALRVGGAADLNVFTVGFTDAGLVGYASYPWEYDPVPNNDGVVINFGTVPGGSLFPYNAGRTLTHEVGHWLGLYHIWGIGNCDYEGDSVGDTPPQSVATYGCPIGQDTCSGGDVDYIWNLMDYSDDACMRKFTRGQTDCSISRYSIGLALLDASSVAIWAQYPAVSPKT